MPVFEIFDGIVVSVFSREHLPPHCHAQYAEYEVLISIKTLDILAGHLPPKPLKKVLAYMSIEANQADLLETFYQLNPQIKRI
ncbi:MAG: DUF4160 domain-containing protein [Cytophagaceae bacterium]|nr:MAG: DUF4160 domain-containing protein [Cytophagaceae bacterium]